MASNKISILQFPLACLAKNFLPGKPVSGQKIEFWPDNGGGLEDQWDRPYGHPVELEGQQRSPGGKSLSTRYIRAE